MKGLIAKKLKMSQSIAEDGRAQAMTIFQVLPNIITQKKTTEKDGYFALQIGIEKPKKKADKRPRYHLKQEFKFPEGDYKIGDTVPLNIFKEGDVVDATGITRGMGFQGTIKRHNFSRGPETHGHDNHRQPGSIGAMGMAWVHKNKRMAGHMGNVTKTVKNLKIVAIDEKANLIAVSGAVPGANQSFISIKHIKNHSYDESGN